MSHPPASSPENAPDLAAIDVLASSIDVMTKVLDDLYPDLMLGHEADDTVHTLILMLSECRIAIADYLSVRAGEPREEEEPCCWLDDDVF